MFSFAGRLIGFDRNVTIEWDAGALRGDRNAVDFIAAVARELDGERIGPVEGPYTFRDHLSDPLSALMLMRDLFHESAHIRGDVPTRPDIPEHAIGD